MLLSITQISTRPGPRAGPLFRGERRSDEWTPIPIWQRHPETKQFILYLDNARYQHARAVREWVEAQKAQGVEFVLDFLPAYSPNLNLIERLWKFLRKRALSRWHPTFEAMQEAVSEVLDHLGEYRPELETLLVERFTVTAPSVLPVRTTVMFMTPPGTSSFTV